MVLGRAARDLGPSRTLEALTPAELRICLLALLAAMAERQGTIIVGAATTSPLGLALAALRWR